MLRLQPGGPGTDRFNIELKMDESSDNVVRFLRLQLYTSGVTAEELAEEDLCHGLELPSLVNDYRLPV